jgi:UDP-N-acetylmuramoyl-tripeptide--D-alanyl-D-alanine ligase
MRKAIFLDRDGTINEEVNYLKRSEDIRFYPNTIKALRNFKNSEFLNIIITNQSGIARGYLTEDGLKEIHSEFRKLLTDEGGELIDDIYYSPYHTDGTIEIYKKESEDRKPGIGMIRKSILKHNIDISESYFIGDSYTDMLCAKNAGLKMILVQTGYGRRDIERFTKDNIEIEFVAKDLYHASLYIKTLQIN